MDRAEKKAILAAARAMREAAITAGDIAAADTLDSLFRQYKAGSVNAVEYGQRINTLFKVETDYNRDAERAARKAQRADTDTTLANSAFSRKVSPIAKDGYQTVRDSEGNIRTIRPKASKVVSGAEAKKSRRIDRQRAERAERQRVAQRAERQAQRAEINAEVAQRAEARLVAETTPAAQRAEADARRFKFEDDQNEKRYLDKGFQTRTLEVVGAEGSKPAFTERDYTDAQRAAAAAARNAAAQRAAARERAARKAK